MTLYLHLVGGNMPPKNARSKKAVGWIHTLGPLETVAEVQGNVRLIFTNPKNPLRKGLVKGHTLLRVDNRYIFAGQLYATYIVNTQRRFPCTTH
jgi:hypothetical protein